MNDSAEFDEFLSPERRYPPKVALFKAMQKRLGELEQEAIQLLLEDVPEQDRAAFLKGTQESPLAPCYKEGAKTPLQIGEANEAKIDLMGRFTDKHEIFTVLFLHLFRDGSPYMFDEDLAVYPYPNADAYTICTSAELEPFIASSYSSQDYIDSEGLRGSPLGHLEKLRAQGLQPRFLSDEECLSVITALPGLELDIERTYRFNTPDYFPGEVFDN